MNAEAIKVLAETLAEEARIALKDLDLRMVELDRDELVKQFALYLEAKTAEEIPW